MLKKAHGIEVLLRKASVDSGFRDLLLRQRGKAAEEIGLDLPPAEQSILGTIPDADLVRMLSKIEVPEVHRKVFMGKTAAAMIALVVGAGILSGCGQACTGFIEQHPDIFPGFFHYDLKGNIRSKLKILQKPGFYAVSENPKTESCGAHSPRGQDLATR